MKHEKHYSAGYLTDTGDFLKQLKMDSYSSFAEIEQGVLLDLGCGVGLDVINLATMLGNSVQVIGIDHDPDLIGKARESGAGLTNVEFLNQEIYQLEFEEGTIFGVRLERVIQHLIRPNDLFREVYRVLRVGHPVVIIETIWNDLNFYTKHSCIEQKIRHYLTNHKVNNGFSGNRLAFDLIENGFKEPELQIYSMVVRSKEEADRYLYLDRILEEMLSIGELSNEEVLTFNNDLILADQMGFFICSINIIIARAVK